MSRPLIQIDDEVRPMNDEEFGNYQALQADHETELQAKEEAKAKREAALAKLTALGLTIDDLSALGL